MPCYNAAATLEEALQSLKNQTLADFELVVVDDGSTDETLAMLQTWAQRDRRIRALNQPHQGIIGALNFGLSACRAQYVARMDADDRCYARRLELQVKFLETHPETSVVSCRVSGFPPTQVRQGFLVYMEWLNALLSDADIRREIFVESPLPHPSVMFRQQAVLQVGGYQEHGWAEDYDLWLRLYLQSARFARLPEVLLEWRERADRLTRTDCRYSLENFLRAKAYYLMRGPLAGRDAVFVWGAGMMGRRLARQLERQKAPLAAFFDIDPRKIGITKRGLPVLSPTVLPTWWEKYENPVMLAAVGARGARILIRQRFQSLNLEEGKDWWMAA
jgi:glycosyltransferase involved in cell wall biosynthesis